MQHSAHLLMIRPVRFDFNAETAVNNSFQVNSKDLLAQDKAAEEFNQFIKVLTLNGIDVTVVNDTPDPHTPDSIFPNNWISFHTDGTICLYPMFAHNRRLERKETVLKAIDEKFIIRNNIDLTHYEQSNLFLEGTGSMVLDRDHHIAYACLSPRTDLTVLNDICNQLNYKPVYFWAFDAGNQPIYHTNVMMCMGAQFVVICLESIPNEQEKQMLLDSFLQTHKQVIDISQDQLNHFAGNMLQVFDIVEKPYLILSEQAYTSLNAAQLKSLEKYNPLIPIAIPTIESLGGGSTRCMMAEIYLIKVFS